MEDFAAKEQKGIKEKNLYILHLDTPRIIIISCVMFGLLVISVLVGMNISKQEERANDFFSNDSTVMDNLLTDTGNSGSIENSAADPVFDSGQIAKNNLNTFNSTDNSFNNNLISPKENILAGNKNEPVSTIQENPNNISDILTHENIESIIPPSSAIKKKEIKPTNKSKKTIKKSKPKASKKKNIVEVSSTEKSYRLSGSKKDYFAIQVASYDRKSRAMSEVDRLENKKFNAFIDTARVNGKKYYRVRVGPIYSQKKAANLLDEITFNERYEESYIIKK